MHLQEQRTVSDLDLCTGAQYENQSFQPFDDPNVNAVPLIKRCTKSGRQTHPQLSCTRSCLTHISPMRLSIRMLLQNPWPDELPLQSTHLQLAFLSASPCPSSGEQPARHDDIREERTARAERTTPSQRGWLFDAGGVALSSVQLISDTPGGRAM